MTTKKYILTFRHLEVSHPENVVAVCDTLEEAQDHVGLGRDFITWSQSSENTWYGDCSALKFVYWIVYKEPPQPPKPLPLHKRVMEALDRWLL